MNSTNFKDPMRGSNFDDLWNDPNFISEEEKASIEFEKALILSLIKIRKQKGISQKKLAELCGMNQSAIARLEKMNTMPQINTLTKLLQPLGYKIDIVPI